MSARPSVHPALEHAVDVVCALRLTPTLAIEYVSPSMRSVLGFDPDDLVADPDRLRTILDPRDLARARTLFGEDSRGTSIDIELRCKAADGSVRWLQVRGSVEQREDDTRVLYAIARDVTAERGSADNRAADRQARLVADNSASVLIRYDADGRVMWASPSLLTQFGFDPATVVGTRFRFAVADDQSRLQAELQQAVTERRTSLTTRVRAATAGGQQRWVDVDVSFVYAGTRAYDFAVVILHDVTAMVDAQLALERSERRFRKAMESAASGMAIVGLDRRFAEVNPALCRLLGQDAGWVLGRTLDDIVALNDQERVRELLKEALDSESGSAIADVRLQCSDGSEVWVEHAVGVLHADDAPTSFVAQFVDMTETYRSRETLRFLASHDSLTQLVNRRELLTRLGRALAYKPRVGTGVGVLYVDLDNFKPVNDTYGHAAGDRLLIDVAGRISAQVRLDDIVARLGGDEFVVVLPAVTSTADAKGVATKIHRAMDQPFSVDGTMLRVQLSIGVAFAVPGDDADEALRRADIALYRAKRSGGDRTVAYDVVVDEPHRHRAGA